MRKLITPISNLNGNTPESLIEQLKLVLHNINHLEASISSASDCWHGRNFQTVKDGDQVRLKAEFAWHDRREWLHQLHQDVTNMALEIQGQKHPKGWESVEGGVMPDEKGNDTLGVVLNETHADGDDAPLGPKTGGR